MLSIFPELFDFGFLALGVFRIAVGLVHLEIGISGWRERKDRWRLVQAVAAGFFVIGFFTQLAALVLAGLVAASFVPQKEAEHTSQFRFLLIASTLVLLFAGPGAFAFDLPF